MRDFKYHFGTSRNTEYHTSFGTGGAEIVFLFHNEGEQDECADANKTRD
jgi:hypothetical protein